MRVKIPGLEGTTYIAKFTHIQAENDACEPVRHTECMILEKDDDAPLDEENLPKLGYVSVGYARCHPNDNFEKELGRQMSLKKALEDGDFTKEARTSFWDVYRNWGKERF